MHCFAGESRCRQTVGNALGVTFNEVKQHVLSKVPELAKKAMSRSTIHQLLVAPRHNTRNAKHYYALIDAKVLYKESIVHGCQQNGHYDFVQVNNMHQCCAEFADVPICLSCDDMNKIHVWILSVSHYCQVHRILPDIQLSQFSVLILEDYSIRIYSARKADHSQLH